MVTIRVVPPTPPPPPQPPTPPPPPHPTPPGLKVLPTAPTPVCFFLFWAWEDGLGFLFSLFSRFFYRTYCPLPKCFSVSTSLEESHPQNYPLPPPSNATPLKMPFPPFFNVPSKFFCNHDCSMYWFPPRSYSLGLWWYPPLYQQCFPLTSLLISSFPFSFPSHWDEFKISFFLAVPYVIELYLNRRFCPF